MYDSLNTPKVTCFNDHFIKPDPGDVPDPDIVNHPTRTDISIEEWRQCKDFPIIFILEGDREKFYCSHKCCNRWYSLNNTFGNIKIHIKSKHLIKNHEINDFNNEVINNLNSDVPIRIPTQIDKQISSKFKMMILKTGRPFSLVADSEMKSILKCLGTRQELAARCEEFSTKIKSKIKYILSSSSYISVALDEWSDLCKRRYLGITARCIYDGIIKIYFLGLNRITLYHCTGDELFNILKNILESYGIADRVINAVTDNCNLMQNAFTYSNILRLPCACHLLNIFMKAFLKPSESTIQEIASAAKCIKTSVCYTALKDDFEEPRIASYTEIRWLSLYESFKTLSLSKDSIETFYLIQDHQKQSVKNKLTSFHCEFIEKMLPVLKSYKSIVKILEGDDFGIISLVLTSFKKLSDVINHLPATSFYENIKSFKSEYKDKMDTFHNQLHPLYDAAAILNPYIGKETINIEEGIQYIHNQMRKLGWTPEKAIQSTNKTVAFLNSQTNSQTDSQTIVNLKSPVEKLLDLGLLELKEEENIGDALYDFWMRRLSSNIDSKLAEVAIGILNAYCTSCSAERSFSKAGRVFTRDRMRIMPEVAESQIVVMSNKEVADSIIKFD